MSIDYRMLLAYLIGIILLYFLGRLFLVPLKIILKLVYNALIGGVVLLAINFVGNMFGYHIAFNILTALTVGFLGVPGIVLLILLKFLFKI